MVTGTNRQPPARVARGHRSATIDRGRRGGPGGVVRLPSGGWARALVVAAVLLLLPAALWAEVRLSAGVEAYESIVRRAEDDWRAASSGIGTITLDAAGSRNVRGELAVTIPLTSIPLPSVERAYLRFRLPWFRVTLGVAPASWGEGLLFNAGDIVNPAYDPASDFLTGDYRSVSSRQWQVYVPLGPFSFLEALYLPAVPDAETVLARLLPAAAGTPGATDTAATGATATDPGDLYSSALLPALGDGRWGGRVYVDAEVVAFQAGYLYEEPAHAYYASLQGSLWADFYLAASQEIDGDAVGEIEGSDRAGEVFEHIRDSTSITGGGFYVFSLPTDRSVSLRLEGALRPADLSDGVPTAASVGVLADLTVSPTLTLGAQAIVLPADPSALVSATVSWNLDQGLTLMAATQGRIGAADAVFAWQRDGLAATLGARYVY